MGVSADDRRRAGGDGSSGVEDDDVVGRAHDQRHVVLDQKHGDSGVGDPAQHGGERDLVGAHEAGGGLVEQQHLGPRRQRAGDLDEATVDVREILRRRVDGAMVADEREEARGRRAFGGRHGGAEGVADVAAAGAGQYVVKHAQACRTAGSSDRCGRCRHAAPAMPVRPRDRCRRDRCDRRRGDRSRRSC